MNEFPPGSPNFQLPRPLKGVVFATDDGRVFVTYNGATVQVWNPPRPVPPAINTGD